MAFGLSSELILISRNLKFLFNTVKLGAFLNKLTFNFGISFLLQRTRSTRSFLVPEFLSESPLSEPPPPEPEPLPVPLEPLPYSPTEL